MFDFIEFTFEPNKSKICGFFDEDDGQIYINKKLGKISKKIVFVHEAQHRECFNSGCKCYEKKNIFLCEYHAFKAELRFVEAKNDKRFWAVYFEGVVKDLEKFNSDEIRGWKEHFRALRKVCRMNSFIQRAKEYKYWGKIKPLLEEK